MVRGELFSSVGGLSDICFVLFLKGGMLVNGFFYCKNSTFASK